MRQAMQWRLLLENPADGLKLPQQPKGEIQVLTLEQARIFVRSALATPYGPGTRGCSDNRGAPK
jgi:hypothetical protein